ncbi:winged helix-turn-helix domain-containing protein [Wukongibacter baidiensis]|uniref:ArsR/SmtB family transcription factor n=1 Tax=Wukongibacter baidiensis TaxID=1723361 RepID=UPI003D7FBFA4
MSDFYELRVLNKPLYFVELISCLNGIVENYNENQNIGFLDERDKSFLRKLLDSRLKGRELFEFALYLDELTDVKAIITKIREIEVLDFIYIFFGGELSKKEVELIYNDFGRLDIVLSKNKDFENINKNLLKTLFKETEVFKNDFITILTKIDKYISNDDIIDNDLYFEKVNNIATKLREKTPLNVAQEIMGKKFKRVYDFSYFLFVPSFYFIHKPMRIFNEKTQLLVYPVMELDKAMDSAELATILKVIGDKTRLEIIKVLSNRPIFGKQLSKQIGVSTSTISHHLEQLKSIGLIYEERDKNTKYFSLNRNTYKKIVDVLNNFINS